MTLAMAFRSRYHLVTIGKPTPVWLSLCMRSPVCSQRAFHYYHAGCWSILDHASCVQISACELAVHSHM